MFFWAFQDRSKLLELLTFENVENVVKERVEAKTRRYAQSQGDDETCSLYKIKPNLVAHLYTDWIMPLTKEVQVEYLLKRLD